LHSPTDCFGTPAAAQYDSGLPRALSTDQWLTTDKGAAGEAGAHGGVSCGREAILSIDASGTRGLRQYGRLPGAASYHQNSARPRSRLGGKTALAEQRHGILTLDLAATVHNSRQRQNPLKDRSETDQHTSSLRRFASRPSRTNLSMAQKQIAPTTQIIRIPIRSEIIASPCCPAWPGS